MVSIYYLIVGSPQSAVGADRRLRTEDCRLDSFHCFISPGLSRSSFLLPARPVRRASELNDGWAFHVSFTFRVLFISVLSSSKFPFHFRFSTHSNILHLVSLLRSKPLAVFQFERSFGLIQLIRLTG